MKNSSKDHSTLIKAIFTNLLFVIGVILMIVGFIRGASTVSKTLVFDNYPLNSYEENQCDHLAIVRPVEPVAEDIKQSPEDKAECESRLTYQRNVKQTEDVVGSISFFVSGLALTIAFKRFIFEQK